jgi:hypothetical protein
LDAEDVARDDLPGRFGEKHDQSTKDEGRDYLTSERYTPLLAVTCPSPSHVAAIANPGRKDLAKSIEQLLETRDSSSNLAMGNLWLIDRNDHCQDANTDTCNETTNVKHCDHDASRLDDASDDENAACHEDGPATTETIRVWGKKGAAEASGRE